MADSNRLLLSILVALIFTGIASALDTEDVDVSESSLKVELDQLNSKINFLESSIAERIREVGEKHESIKQMEEIIQEKSNSIASLQDEIQSLQHKGSLDSKEQVGKTRTRAVELEKQVADLKREIESQNKRKDALEARATKAENKILELNSKLEELERINNEQKNRIRKTEHALQVAEEEMLKAKMEATSFSKEFTEVRGAWIPPWLALHAVQCQSFALTHWKEHGKPALDLAVHKTLETKARLQKWAEPHVETFKTKWIPIMMEGCLTFVANVEPQVQSLTVKIIEVYHASMTAIEPHAVKVQKMVDPYVQEARKVMQPYIDQLAIVTKPHLEKAYVILKPYTKKAHHTYKRVMKSASKYHHQVQGTIHTSLKNNEYTKPLASRELAWYMATILMALLVLLLFKLLSSVFSKKPKKRTRTSRTSHTRRSAKQRSHRDK